jgi:hypothetical protein
MSTHQRNPRVPHRHRTGLGSAAVALGALVAIAVTILFLALTSAGYTVRATSTIHTSSPSTHHMAPIQHRGTVACHPELDPLTRQTHGGCPPH